MLEMYPFYDQELSPLGQMSLYQELPEPRIDKQYDHAGQSCSHHAHRHILMKKHSIHIPITSYRLSIPLLRDA